MRILLLTILMAAAIGCGSKSSGGPGSSMNPGSGPGSPTGSPPATAKVTLHMTEVH